MYRKENRNVMKITWDKIQNLIVLLFWMTSVALQIRHVRKLFNCLTKTWADMCICFAYTLSYKSKLPNDTSTDE